MQYPNDWQVGKHATDPNQLVVHDGGKVIAFLPCNMRVDYAQTAELIAQAPQLLDLCKAALFFGDVQKSELADRMQEVINAIESVPVVCQ